MKNIKLTLQYDGTDFKGFQIQNDERTVQGEIKKALKKVLNEDIITNGCSRTDAGVHAKEYILNFLTNSSIPADRMMYPLNDKLPMDVRVLKSEEVDLDFHARYSVKEKTYIYNFVNRQHDLPLDNRYSALVKIPIDYEKMKDCLNLFIGKHDFKAYMSNSGQIQTTIRTIKDLQLIKNGEKYTMIITGDGFLYNMVRIIAGSLIYVGQGTLTKDDLLEALETGNRKKRGKVCPAKGLTLEKVYY